MRGLLELLTRATAARLHGQIDAAAERRPAAAFACSRRLAVYGSLAPGAANERLLATCPGTWSRGTVTGWRAQREHPVLTFDPTAPAVPVQVLHSDALPEHWPRLDAFEGDEYRRILVPVALPAGGGTVANLYEAVRGVTGSP